MLPLISCLCATKNRRRFIPRSIEMFKRQDYAGPAEMVIIEDGDDCVEDLVPSVHYEPVVVTHSKEKPNSIMYPRTVRYCRVDGSVGKKYNTVVQTLDSELCCLWDDDDWGATSRLSLQYQHLQISGAQLVALSSSLYYQEGDDFAHEYFAPPNYASGFSHCFYRDWILAHPHEDLTLGEDMRAIEEAVKHHAVSFIAGMDCMVACDHDSNCSPRPWNDTNPLVQAFNMALTPNWKIVPFSRVSAIVSPYLLERSGSQESVAVSCG